MWGHGSSQRCWQGRDDTVRGPLQLWQPPLAQQMLVSWLRESSDGQALECSFSELAFAVLQKPLGSHSVNGDNDPDCTCCSHENCNKVVLPCTTETATSARRSNTLSNTI